MPYKFIHFFLRFVLVMIIMLLAFVSCNQERSDSAPPIELSNKFDCLPSPLESQSAKVISVIDGDTVKIQINDQKINVRYIGINAPELNSDERELAKEAMRFNAELVENQIITLYPDTSDTDRFGRLLRYVFVEDIFVNYELVRMGYARQRDYPPDSSCKELFIKAQEEAISMRRGIWKTQ